MTPEQGRLISTSNVPFEERSKPQAFARATNELQRVRLLVCFPALLRGPRQTATGGIRLVTGSGELRSFSSRLLGRGCAKAPARPEPQVGCQGFQDLLR